MAEKGSDLVISLGGSIAFADGINEDFLESFCHLIEGEISLKRRFVVIVGGGQICREYQKAAVKLGVQSDEERDWIGIYSTWLNARLVRAVLKKYAHPILLTERNQIKDFGTASLIIGGGWHPGNSTDYCAVQTAVDLGIKQVVNLGKPPYVYTANPDQNPAAKPLAKLNWADYFKIIPPGWQPGMNVPFDVEAAKLAEKEGLEVIVAYGGDLDNFKNILEGESYRGTLLSNNI